MLLKNVNIFTKEKQFQPGAILIEQGIIQAVIPDSSAGSAQLPQSDEAIDGIDSIDGEGCYAIPGMIDLHFHGCAGYDFCDGTIEALEKIAAYELSIGVTAIAPAVMALPYPELLQALQNAADYKKRQAAHSAGAGARLAGIHMEAPFISKVKKGAQDERYIRPCSIAEFRAFMEASEGLVKVIGIAPEEGGAMEFIRQAKGDATVAFAHTNADYGTARQAIREGASHAVHLYNAMPPFLSRAPGVVGAVADSCHVTAELICDGVHLHPAVVRGAFRMLGAERIILISDSMRAAGLGDGTYFLGGQQVCVQGRHAALTSTGDLAGSVTPLPDCVRILVKEMGIPLETAVACATENPARRLNIFDRYGSIEEGKAADIVLWNQNLELMAVIQDGRKIRQREFTFCSHFF